MSERISPADRVPFTAEEWRTYLAAHPEVAKKLLAAATPRTTKYFAHSPFPQQAAFLLLSHREVLYGGAAGGGKALALDTPIPTPDGWKAMGDLQPGDWVFDEAGQPCRVLACSEVMEDRPCFGLEFSDGARIVADAGHLWVTMTVAEREAARRREPEFRAARRATRPRRGRGLRPDLVKANEARDVELLEPPGGSPRTTEEIAKTLIHRGRTNHSVAVAGALELPEAELPIDPYLLGLWLGDGRSDAGSITTQDEEIAEAFKSGGYEVHRQAGRYAYGIRGLATDLRRTGVFGAKHIPAAYLRASQGQRLALLQGLMDTDGCAYPNGACEFTTCSESLRDGFHELIASLGIKGRPAEGRAKLNGKDCGPKWRFKFLAEVPTFRLRRKLEAQKLEGFRGTHAIRYIVAARSIPSVPVRCIKVDAPSRCFLAGRDMIPTHNSDALLMAALQYVDVPGYRALLLRRTFADLALPGALMDRAEEWLRGTDAKWSERDKTWTFPSGATLTFGYLETEKDKFRYQGAEFQFIGFDELTQFTKTQYTYLFSRLRRLEGAAVPLRMRAASNPGGSGHEWVHARFFKEGRKRGRVFIPSTLDDNPHLDKAEYRESLAELDPITRRQLEKGDWNAKHEGNVFRRDWFRVVDELPDEAARAVPLRYWDFAATEDEEGKDPDWTAGAKGILVGEDFYVLDVRRDRLAPEGVERFVQATAEEDGKAVRVHIEQEPGSSGKSTISHFERNVLQGYIVAADRPTGPKRERWKPLVSRAYRGHVYLLRGPWLKDFLDEAESVSWVDDGSTHDDQIDAVSGLYSKLLEGDAGWLAAMMKG